MSPILPISFLVTLLCAFGAIEGALFQEFMFVGAALSATILVCSLEAWSAREIPVLGPLTGQSGAGRARSVGRVNRERTLFC